jgi:hypothetical protein
VNWNHWWTLDLANAFVSPGINSRAELVPSPRAYARNGAPRRWLEDRQQALTNLDRWSSVNNLKFNASKCKVLTVTRKRSPILHTYQLGSKELFMSDLFITNTKDRPCISPPPVYKPPPPLYKPIKNCLRKYISPGLYGIII